MLTGKLLPEIGEMNICVVNGSNIPDFLASKALVIFFTRHNVHNFIVSFLLTEWITAIPPYLFILMFDRIIEPIDIDIGVIIELLLLLLLSVVLVEFLHYLLLWNSLDIFSTLF